MSRLISDKKRFAALLLAAVMCFAVLSAICFIGAEAEHECSGDDCSICCQIAKCENILKSAGAFVSVAVSAFFVYFCIIAAFSITENFSEHFTLVTLNIKLSD